MVMTARERLRKHREKLKEDPAKYAKYLEKQRAYVAAKRKKVAEMGKREHRRTKKMWRESKKKQRAKEKAANFRPPTPPSEPVSPPRVAPSGNQPREGSPDVTSSSDRLESEIKEEPVSPDRKNITAGSILEPEIVWLPVMEELDTFHDESGPPTEKMCKVDDMLKVELIVKEEPVSVECGPQDLTFRLGP
uniref:Uncharacterized protein n=1 Tax=Lygus hesperus TaxID=30085 RepID=A0A146MBS2_LYGHE